MLPRGIVPVLQTPFTARGGLDLASLGWLIEAALAGGAAGFLTTAVASETATLTEEERERVVRFIIDAVGGRVPVIAGCSAPTAHQAARHVRHAEARGASAILLAPPVVRTELPLIVQDLDWTGPGMELRELRGLRKRFPTLAGVKIETVPAGPKYSQVRRAFGARFHISGGWAVPQMIEALDRGVDALIPESSMVGVYAAIWRHYAAGRRETAVQQFRRLLPIVAFTNQELRLSVAFFKRLLVRQGILRSAKMRLEFTWDRPQRRIADELIDLYRSLI